ncbi:MAG: hypothetical protein CVV41_15005 [Candidatus Riflebacteria bacterium HGW-Riflebacteria-1]|jgi:hypothetical protein|nr:MAG: hypothetical protein CVV41_15005 [Candidatus Riflebacteria bacterium HGW-Riflebacteria-1]
MLFKSFRSLSLVFVLLLSFVSSAAMASCSSCPSSCPSSCAKQQEITYKSIMLILDQIKILEVVTPKDQVENSAKAIQNILCEMKRMKLTDQGDKYAKLSRGYFEKTLANLGKEANANSHQPCHVTYPLAVYFFGKLCNTELDQQNPFKENIWFYIEREMKFAKAAIEKQDSSADEKARSISYQKAMNHIKIALKFIAALDSLTENQVKQIQNSFQRCQVAYSQKDYASFDKNMKVLYTSLLRLKGIISADKC